MRKSKSCEDIEILYKNLNCGHNTNPNVNVTNLIKSSLCHKLYDLNEPNAYDLATQEKIKDKQNLRLSTIMNQHIQFLAKQKCGRKRMYSQEQLQQLLNIEDELKFQAYRLICGENSFKIKSEIKITAKQLSQIQAKTVKDLTKRNQMVKKIMMGVTQKCKAPKKQKNKQQQNNTSAHSVQDISSSFKSSMTDESVDTQRNRQNKSKKLRAKLKLQNYQKVLSTQRRKQAWNAYKQAERTKISMVKPIIHNTNGTSTSINAQKIGQKNTKRSQLNTKNECGDANIPKYTQRYKSINKQFQMLQPNLKFQIK